MNQPEYPSTTQWQQLYALADELKKLAPWDWMIEIDIFGVKDPYTGDIGFVSVMGQMGEHIAVAFYAGFASLDRFWDMQDLGDDLTAEFLLNTPHLQVSFEDRQTLEKYDLQIIKKLGRKYRGSNAWPRFRSLRAGYVPWRLLADEARFLIHALPQVVEVAQRFRANPDLLDWVGEDEAYLVRVPERVGDEWQWHDEWWPMQPPIDEPLPVQLDQRVMAQLAQLPASDSVVELDFFLVPAVIQEHPDTRPRFPYMLLAVDGDSGTVLGNDMLLVETTWPGLLADLPNRVAHMLLEYGSLPDTILVSNPQLYELITFLPASANFSLQLVEELMYLEQAKTFLMDMI